MDGNTEAYRGSGLQDICTLIIFEDAVLKSLAHEFNVGHTINSTDFTGTA